MTLESKLKEIKEQNQDCICDARYSGIDEAENSARGCPGCECHHRQDVPMLLEMVEYFMQNSGKLIAISTDRKNLKQIMEKYYGK